MHHGNLKRGNDLWPSIPHLARSPWPRLPYQQSVGRWYGRIIPSGSDRKRAREAALRMDHDTRRRLDHWGVPSPIADSNCIAFAIDAWDHACRLSEDRYHRVTRLQQLPWSCNYSSTTKGFATWWAHGSHGTSEIARGCGCWVHRYQYDGTKNGSRMFQTLPSRDRTCVDPRLHRLLRKALIQYNWAIKVVSHGTIKIRIPSSDSDDDVQGWHRSAIYGWEWAASTEFEWWSCHVDKSFDLWWNGNNVSIRCGSVTASEP